LQSLSHPISFDEAQLIAADLACQGFTLFDGLSVSAMLNDEFLEAQGCWIFFISDDALTRLGNLRGPFFCTAYAIAKSGDPVGLICDFRATPGKMNDYLELWSMYALGKREEANRALEVFMQKYPSE
jgi:hypothetical protein